MARRSHRWLSAVVARSQGWDHNGSCQKAPPFGLVWFESGPQYSCWLKWPPDPASMRQQLA